MQKITRSKSFLITIDTEGDNVWARSDNTTTKNASFLRRFQTLCEKYKLKPVYLTNYEMANSSEFQDFGRDVLRRNVAEIGMHLHAWNSPPYFKLTNNDFYHHPYLIEYPIEVMKEKIDFMTNFLESIFEIKIKSHRAGRWSFDDRYAKILVDNGYKVDCSVTPFISWKNCMGDPAQSGGTDFTNFSQDAYFLNLEDISKAGTSPLLEIPVSIDKIYPAYIESVKNTFKDISLVRKPLNYLFPLLTWLRPNGKNLKHMLALLKRAELTGKDYVQFILHSSELMPGCSPTFASDNSIKKLYDDLEILFSSASNNFCGCTLQEYYDKIWSRIGNPSRK